MEVASFARQGIFMPACANGVDRRQETEVPNNTVVAGK